MFILQQLEATIRKTKSHFANIITLGNISFGCASVLATLSQAYSHAILYIFIAALLDRYDGKVARKFNQESDLGKQLDSMSDVISFGVAPALLIHGAVLSEFGSIGSMITVFYMVCGAFRLARFNITESDGYFSGLPITAAGVILTVSYFAIPFINTQFYIGLFFFMGLAMISSFKLKKV